MPGEEVLLAFGFMGMISDGDRRRRLYALVFTAVYSRFCFVYLSFSQTTQAVIAGCEAAWAFYGGVFRGVVADHPKAGGGEADPLGAGGEREGAGERAEPRARPRPGTGPAAQR